MPDDLVEMARLAQHDERMATGALYGDLADRIEELEAKLAQQDDLVQAERERCAKIAWSHVDDETSGDPDFDAGWEAAACAITDAIRKGGE